MSTTANNMTTTESRKDGDNSVPPPRWRNSVAPPKGKVNLPPTHKTKAVETPKPEITLPKRQPSAASNLKPREARQDTESLSDLAVFVKSTGPPQTSTPDRDIKPQRNISASSNKANGRQQPARSPTDSKGTHPRLEARSASSTAGGESSDLIDFIRTGPIKPGEHRIPLPVAPFQDPVDSDQDPSVWSYSGKESNPEARSMANRSTPSFGSNTGLLDSKDKLGTQATSTSKPPMPKASNGSRPPRKQLQPRDPYIINLDLDEDDDDLSDLLGGPKKKPQKESMMDFLNIVPPPPAPEPQPFITSSTRSMSNASGATGTGTSRILNKKLSKASVQSQGENYTHKPPKSPAAMDSKRTPSLSTIKRDPASAGSPPRSSTLGPNRETGTSALADFLKNTGPPEPPPVLRGYTTTSVTGGGKAKNSNSGPLSKLFGRRRKIGA